MIMIEEKRNTEVSAEEALRMIAKIRFDLAREESMKERKLFLFRLKHPVKYLRWSKTEEGIKYKRETMMRAIGIGF